MLERPTKRKDVLELINEWYPRVRDIITLLLIGGLTKNLMNNSPQHRSTQVNFGKQ